MTEGSGKSNIRLKRTFEDTAAKVLQGLNELETVSGQLRPDLGATAIAVQRRLAEAREAVQKAQNEFSGGMAMRL